MAGVVAWFTHSTLKTLGAGMVALWVLQALGAADRLTSKRRTPRRPEITSMRFEGTDTYVATARPDARGQRGARAGASAAHQGRARHRQDAARRGGRARARPAALQWHIKSTTKAQQGLYEYDAVSRLRDSQLGDGRVADIANYIKRGVLWEAFDSATPRGRADRRDRQGRHRVSERPAARARPDGVLRLRDAPDDRARGIGRSSSSRRTTRRSCPTRSCAAASSTTSAFPTARR